VANPNVSRTLQSYLTFLTDQVRLYASLRLFGGLEALTLRKMCLDAQIPALLGQSGQLSACDLVAQVSYGKVDRYHQEVLRFESHYDPGEVMELGPARWDSPADTLAYQLVGQVVQWKRGKQVVTFGELEATTALKPDRQRFYL
jgi:hypothetical protein